MTRRRGVAVSRTVAVLAVVFLIGVGAAVAVLYGRLPAAAAPGRTFPPPEAPVTAEPVSGPFTELPYACGLLTKSQFGELVHEPFSRRDGRGGCEWDSLDDPANPRDGLALRLRLLPNEARAREYFQALRTDAEEPPLVAGLGDEAYAARGDMSSALPGFGRRMVVRLGNLIAEIDYRRYGATADRDGRLERGARQAATWAVQALRRLR
ncbi:hypothetical protein [Nonomuraea cavernae]|uniref:DUF3558 domain-containing protein n=1 Tax=Nonomuraea cavernae TaxID=2045107 RepID=A0A918DJB3_9ACTN|nr:hypothetical protein [Nonomuraea cavernae]MCA2186140.1 hypothetical protein [Nonomuraea cavernae]GGO70093.1 hypothetical protein GCM10012289_32730 [Nonomuraea cavernae]